jgi:hypothetical protein
VHHFTKMVKVVALALITENGRIGAVSDKATQA